MVVIKSLVRFRHSWAFVAAIISLGLPFAQSSWAQNIEPDADKILKSMTSYLADLKTFTAEYDVANEVVDRAGQKLQFSASGTLAIERPGKLHITRRGAFVDGELTFDGKTISLYGKDANIYAQIDSPGPTIDDAIEEVRVATGIDAAGADLILDDAYTSLTADVEKGVDVGIGYVGGVECDHLAFRGPSVDWQIWIQTGEKPLPMKYVITTKWVTGAPQYTIRFQNWNVDPQLEANMFEFSPAADAKKIEQVQADEIGELTGEVQP